MAPTTTSSRQPRTIAYSTAQLRWVQAYSRAPILASRITSSEGTKTTGNQKTKVMLPRAHRIGPVYPISTFKMSKVTLHTILQDKISKKRKSTMWSQAPRKWDHQKERRVVTCQKNRWRISRNISVITRLNWARSKCRWCRHSASPTGTAWSHSRNRTKRQKEIFTLRCSKAGIAPSQIYKISSTNTIKPCHNARMAPMTSAIWQTLSLRRKEINIYTSSRCVSHLRTPTGTRSPWSSKPWIKLTIRSDSKAGPQTW